MTRKHFIALAEILRKHHRGISNLNRRNLQALETSFTAFKILREEIADFCAEQNPRFDREKFMERIND